jgi:hypothetical protein
VKVYTSDLKKYLEGTDAKVYLSFIDDENETEKVFLNRKNIISTHENIFETGQMDEFTVRTRKGLKRLNKIRIGHDNSGFSPGWHLKKVEVTTSKDGGQYYLFNCNQWLAKTEGDKKIERILDADSSGSRESRLSKISKNSDQKSIKGLDKDDYSLFSSENDYDDSHVGSPSLFSNKGILIFFSLICAVTSILILCTKFYLDRN